MHRQIIYAGQIPLETDLLNAQKNDMIGLAKLCAAVLGTTTQVNGLACNPNAPAALNVVVSPGEIYSLQNIDGTAYSSLAADTTHQIVKQGILLDAVTLATPAPGTAGQSINYLVQAAYLDTDALPVVLPYYNASNPAQAYSGPANAGTTNNTVRQGQCSVTIKAGIAAATGTQTTPAADAGYTGLYVVAVANGQATVVAGNITTLVGAPFIPTTLINAAGLNLANVFTQFQSAPTPALFDISTKLATMAALRNASTAYNGLFSVTGAATLTAAQCMGIVYLGAGTANQSIVLPPASNMPIGQRVLFLSNANNVTLTRGGASDAIYGIATAGGSVTSFVANLGDCITLVAGTNAWYSESGSLSLGSYKQFASLGLNNGYQKLPSGIILQWGLTAVANSGADVTTTLPIAFPTQFLRVLITQGYTAGSGSIGYAGGDSASLSTFTWRGSVTGNSFNYFAIGY